MEDILEHKLRWFDSINQQGMGWNSHITVLVRIFQKCKMDGVLKVFILLDVRRNYHELLAIKVMEFIINFSQK